MQRSHPAFAELAFALREGGLHAGRRPDVIPGGEQVAGVKARSRHAHHRRRRRAMRPARRRSGPSVPPCACRVLEMKLAALAFGERPLRSSRRLGRSLRRRRPSLPSPGGARRRTADSRPDTQRMGQGGERFGADFGVLASAVEQVDGVDQHRVNRTFVHGLAEGLDVVEACRSSASTYAATG